MRITVSGTRVIECEFGRYEAETNWLTSIVCFFREGNILIGDDPDNKPEQWAFKQLDTGAASDWSVPYDVNTMLQQGALCWYYRKVYDQDPGHDQAAATISIKITGKSKKRKFLKVLPRMTLTRFAYEGTTSVYVVYVPGTAEIKVMGWNDVYLYNEVWRGVYQHATSRTDKYVPAPSSNKSRPLNLPWSDSKAKATGG